MALHLNLTQLFGDGNDSRMTRDAFAGAFSRAAAVRDFHLVNRPEWRGLGQREEFLAESRNRAKQVKDDGETDAFVVLGIGGSALGNSALVAALGPVYQEFAPASGCPRIFIPDSIDPDWIQALLDTLPLDRTHFNVISKSGGTIETAAEFLIFFDAVKKALGSEEKARQCFTITTDPAEGHFRKLCNELNFPSLTVPPGVGGRFSILTSVGLFTSEMAGFDSESLLEGASRVDRNLSDCLSEEDPALAWALAHVLYMEQGKNVHVHFPYSYRIRLLADWYKQLWAESLGKRFSVDGKEICVGPTPVKAIGPTDQHSQVQLYAEGPDDKVYTFLKVRDFSSSVEIPEPFVSSPAFDYLRGSTLNDIVEAERQGTEVALTDVGRPVSTLEICKVDAFHLGQYFQFMEIATAYAGGLLGIDAFNQPGVEAGKVAALALMGAGHEERAKEIRLALANRDLFQLSC